MGLSGLIRFYFNTFVFHINARLINFDKALPVSTPVLVMQEFPSSRLSSRFTFLSHVVTFTVSPTAA